VDYDAGTERPFWPRRDGNPLVEVEVLLKERLPVHGNCEERFLLSRKKYSRGVA